MYACIMSGSDDIVLLPLAPNDPGACAERSATAAAKEPEAASKAELRAGTMSEALKK